MTERQITHWGDGTECCGKPHVVTCGNCGHTRAAHTNAGRCHHVDCDCRAFMSHAEAHRHCYQDVHNCAWLTDEEQAMPRKGSR